MTTGDAVDDVTHMIAQLMVPALVPKTKEDEEVVVTALDTALADSVTKTALLPVVRPQLQQQVPCPLLLLRP